MASQSILVPKWLDQVPGVDFGPEKDFLSTLESWALEQGWEVSAGEDLPFALRERTDVVLENPKAGRRLRLAVLPKPRGSKGGTIRIDASSLRSFELVYHTRGHQWRLETGGVPLTDDFSAKGWAFLEDLAFRQ